MKKINFMLVVLAVIFISKYAMAFTVELDPLTPLTEYISMAEWNTDGDFEDWAYNAHIIDAEVSGGNFIGKDDGADPVMNLNIDSLTSPDPRIELATVAGTIFEVRMQFETNTLNERIDFWATINGAGPGSFSPMQFASTAAELPDVPTDGEFHVFRITLEEGDNYIGNLDALRLDPVADNPPIGEIFKLDYFRIAKVTNEVIIIRVDPTPLFNYTSIAEWDTAGDFEDWIFANIASSNVSGGAMSGTPMNGDPYFYKTTVPQVDLNKAPILEFRIKQTASFISNIEIFFGATDDPNFGGTTYAAIPQSNVPADGNFHVYQYDMSTVSTWKNYLLAFRIDPYVGDGAIGKTFEIDYIRVGTTKTPKIDPVASQGTYSNKILVSWEENDIINKYQVWRNTTNDSSTATINSPEITTNIFEDTTVTPEISYYYWVKAFMTNEWSDFGNSAFGFATLSTGPDTPVNISPADGAVSSLPIFLEASDYSDEYGWPMEAVQWQLDSTTNFGFGKWDSGILLTNSTTIQPPNAIFETQNFWRVRYKNNRDKWSQWSTPTTFNFDVVHNTNSQYYFYDTFNCSGSGDVNNNYYISGRQFGTVAPLNYTIFGQTETGSDSDNPGELMVGLSSGVSPNYSFTKSGNFKIEFDVINHNFDKTNNWISLSFGKDDNSDLFPVSPSGAGLVFFANGGFQAFDGETLAGNGWGVPVDEKLHIILTAATVGFDYDEVRYSAFANGIPMVVVNSPNLGYVYNDATGFDKNYISLYSYNSVSTNTSLFDNLKISAVENTVTVTNWLSDSDLLPMNPAKTTHAVNVNGESVTINGVDFIGTGVATNPSFHANGSAILQSNGWELISANGSVIFHNGENVTNLVTDSGSKTLMKYFAYFNAPGGAAGLKLSGLSPFSSNVISLYSYGWENAIRSCYISSTSGGTITNVNQDTYGVGTGIIVRYGYVADKNGKATIVISTTGSAGWHLSGFYSEEISAPVAQISVADKIDFGEVIVGTPSTLQLEVMNTGSGIVSGSIAGVSAPFSLADSYWATAATADLINVTFNPTGEDASSQTLTLSGNGGSAQVELTGTGVPEPLLVIGYLLSVICLFFARKNN